MVQVPDYLVYIAPYKGSKYRQLKNLLPFIPYGKILNEPFCGFASVSLNHPAPIKYLTDQNEFTYLVLTELKDNFSSLCHLISEQLVQPEHTPQATYYSVNSILYAIEETTFQAAAYLLHALLSYGGGGTRFDSQITKPFRLESLLERLQICSDRLQDACLSHGDGMALTPHVEHYHEPDTVVHYFDPPYLNALRGAKDKRHKDPAKSMTRSQYLHEFKEADHQNLCDLSINLKGSVIISNYEGEPYSSLTDYGFEKFQYTAYDAAASPRIETLWLNSQAISKLAYVQRPAEQLSLIKKEHS